MKRIIAASWISAVVSLAGAAAPAATEVPAFIQKGAGAIERTSLDKLQEVISIKDFGAKCDGVTDDSPALQRAIDAAQAHSLAPITGTPGSAIVGGATVVFPNSPSGCKLASTINITKSKIILHGPARLLLADKITGFTFNFPGSSYKSGVVFEDVDITGGAIGVDIGSNAVPMPVHFDRVKFVNQTIAGIKTGNFGFWVSVQRSIFTGGNYGIWHRGAAADGLIVEKSVFIYNSNYDIFVENGANVFRIENNDFVGNLKVPASSAAHIFIDATTTYTAAHSTIHGNKFGQEGRKAGNIIVLKGTGARVITGLSIKDNLLHFDSSALTASAIKLDHVQLQASTIRNNTLLFCDLFDVVAESTTTGVGENDIGENVRIDTHSSGAIHRSDWRIADFSEPLDKKNLLNYGRFTSDPSFSYVGGTFSQLSATDESGIERNASTFTAASASNRIRINGFPVVTGKRHTFAIWVKLDVAGLVNFSSTGGASYLFNKVRTIGTNWERLVFDFYHIYETNDYVFGIVIPNGRTITLGAITLVEGRDVGDLWSAVNTNTRQRTVKHFTTDNLPTLGYFTAGQVLEINAPIETGSAGSKYIKHGWRRLTTGSGNTPNTDWFEMRALTGN